MRDALRRVTFVRRHCQSKVHSVHSPASGRVHLRSFALPLPKSARHFWEPYCQKRLVPPNFSQPANQFAAQATFPPLSSAVSCDSYVTLYFRQPLSPSKLGEIRWWVQDAARHAFGFFCRVRKETARPARGWQRKKRRNIESPVIEES